MAAEANLAPIPQPPAVPILGNAHQIDREVPVQSFDLLRKQYGEIYRLAFPGAPSLIFVSSLKLMDQVCDEKRFRKAVRAALLQVRALTHDGLFTARHDEPNWGIAHRILMPAFSPGAIRDMFAPMMDICSQLIAKWDRFGPDYVHEPVEDFTRLAFDTIAFCTMSYRLNSFYTLGQIPFIEAMGDFLTEAGNRARRPALIQNYLFGAVNAKFEKDRLLMEGLTNEVIQARKRSPKKIDDLLGLMLDASDPVSGAKLSDQNIMGNLVTFLIAGHETTSGMLTFATYYALKTPGVYTKLREEVDRVLGREPILPEHLSKLPYMTAVFRETLRVTPSVTAVSLEAIKETVLEGSDGKAYKVVPDDQVVMFQWGLHRDTAVWGEDAEEFRPDRMLNGGFENAPKNAWKPFGNGARACIGRSFALQEAHIVLASIIQKFDLVMVDPSYNLKIKSTLTIKPRDFQIRTIPREGAPSIFAMPGVTSTSASSTASGTTSSKSASQNQGVPLYLAYGTNAGTCKDFASKIAKDAGVHGFRANLVSMDTIESKVPTDGPVVFITASYEGEPPDNARRFVEYLTALVDGGEKKTLANVRYAVFGCGHHDWVATYQRIPKLVDAYMENAGAERLIDRGEGDAGDDSLFESFDAWVPGLWEALKKAYGESATVSVSKSSISIEVTGTTRAKTLQQEGTELGTVVANRLLTPPGVPAKHHIEIKLPEEMTYQAGDYLAILPTNPSQSVKRALARFAMLSEQQIVIKSSEETTLPTDTPISVHEVLSGYVELGQPATRKNVEDLLPFCFESESVAAKKAGEALKALDYKRDVLEKRLSLLDVLEAYPDITIPLASFLSLLPAMRIRQYSISSSPLWNAAHTTLTVSVLDAPHASSSPDKNASKFLGVASNYIAQLRPGDKIQIGVRQSAKTFHLPADPTLPVILICAGSGIAPMRGFMQERAMQVEAGRTVGRVLLFYGCRHPDEDYLYWEEEVRGWEEKGVVKAYPAFSRVPERSEGAKYVQHRLRLCEDELQAAYKDGAKVYVCGSPALANSVKEYTLDLIQRDSPGFTPEQAAATFEKMRGVERYSTDVFA